ncbi:hypothetical protein WN943_005836 [Citrus x changshan-huyou]
MEEQNCDASNGCLGDLNSLYEGNIQVPLDVLIQLFPVDNRANLEIFTLDLAALLFIPICFEATLGTENRDGAFLVNMHKAQLLMMQNLRN